MNLTHPVSKRETCSYLRVAFLALGLFLAMSIVGLEAQTPVIPIPQQLFAKPVPAFIGAPAEPNPITDATLVPEDPFLAPNGRSGIHLDAYQSDTYASPGPLGNKPVVRSSFLAAECGTITFDSKGRINTVCIGARGPELYLMDPEQSWPDFLYQQGTPALSVFRVAITISTSWTEL